MAGVIRSLAHGSFSRPTRIPLWLAGAVFVLALPAAVAEAQSTDVMKVEEDWELVLNEPNENTYSPQFHTTMSPTANLDGFYSQITWNYQEESFSPGGLQVQSWMGEDVTRTRDLFTAPLSTTAETITWTQVLARTDVAVVFRINNGVSTSWGNFSHIAFHWSVQLPDLNGYTTDASVTNSWITYGSNRVNSLKIKAVRRYDGLGILLSTDTTPHIVFQYEDTEEE